MESNSKMNKLLLMGRSGAGKTSMHCIIFASYPANQTINTGFTVGIAESRINFMGNISLNLWDCGGQPMYMKNYFDSQKEIVFNNVEVLIYVFDVKSKKPEEDLNDYAECIQNLKKYSNNAKVFVLLHKMDLITEDEKEQIFEDKKRDILEVSTKCEIIPRELFATSIWDDTLYKAWSQIVQLMIPHIDIIKDSLKKFSEISTCDEVVLFEKETFLIIAFHEANPKNDIVKYERLSTIIKQFKLSYSKMGTDMRSIFVKNSKFSFYVNKFTDNTYIMTIHRDETTQPTAMELSIDGARKYFEKRHTELTQRVNH